MTTLPGARALLVLLGACTTVAALPAAATAATVASRFEESSAPGLYAGRTVVTFAGQPGEDNDIQQRYVADGIVFRDAGVPPQAGDGCEQTSGDEVTCRLRPDTADLVTRIEAGDGDDRVTLATFIAPGQPGSNLGRGVTVAGGDGADTIAADPSDPGVSALSGGPGADTITGGPGDDYLGGGPGPDVLVGGAGDDYLGGDAFPSGGQFPAESAEPRGDDTLDGGPGRDRVDYYGPVIDDGTRVPYPPVTVDLRAGTGGSPGVDADRLMAVESVRGTPGADTLLGDDGPNELDGGTDGKDHIDGRGGDDDVSTSGGGIVIGGAGDDVVGTSRGRARCGPGRDFLATEDSYSSEGRGVPRAIPADCEETRLAGGVLELPIRVAGGVARVHITADDDALDPGSLVLLRRGRVLGRLRRIHPRTTNRSGRDYRLRLTRAGRRAVAGGRTPKALLRFVYKDRSSGMFTLRTELR